MIDTYERLDALMARMVTVARKSGWDDLIALERECRFLVDRLQAAEARAELSPPAARRKAELIKQILSSDAEIRRHTEPRMAQLESLLGHVGNERRLARAYGMGLGEA